MNAVAGVPEPRLRQGRRPIAAIFVAVSVANLVPCQALPIKLATWNLDWLTARSRVEAHLPDDVDPRLDADFARLRAYADHLAADVVAFQEVDGTQAAARVFDPATYAISTIDEDVVQRVGLAVRHGIALTRHSDLTALDVDPGAAHPLRSGLDETLDFADRRHLRLLVVHLKSGCATDPIETSRRPACVLLAQQIPVLAAWVAARRGENIPFAIAGDFNREMETPEALSTALTRAAPLTRVTQGKSNPCWETEDFIDHILLGGGAAAWLVPGSLRVMTYRETDPAMRPHLSDHCPVSVRLDVR
jgi:endonuclease/exonuclease/phosphatase family metal-dependent hydrolase